jgi:hypothetical protein
MDVTMDDEDETAADETAAEAQELARIGLRKVMTADPAEQHEGNVIIERAIDVDPDAVEDVREEIEDSVRKTRRGPP